MSACTYLLSNNKCTCNCVNQTCCIHIAKDQWIFSIILKVLQKVQQNKAQAKVVVSYWTTQNWFSVLLGMLVDHPLIMTASLNKLYLPTHPTAPHPLHPKLKLLVAHISGEISSRKLFLQQHNIFSCPHGENQPGKDITQCCNSCIISVGGNKPIICYQMWPQFWNFSPNFMKKAVNTALLL